MNRRSALRRALGIALTTAGLTLPAASALAVTVTTPTSVAPLSSCTRGTLSQPFSAFNDLNFYTLAPGGNFDAAPMSGWELTRGATVTSTVQPDGTAGGVLDLPSTAQATSPIICITSAYPTARLWARNLAGSEGVFFYVSYLHNGTWTAPKNTGQFHGDPNRWRLSNPMNIQPSNTPGWQQARFTFVAGGTKSRFQVDNFWVDPKMRG